MSDRGAVIRFPFNQAIDGRTRNLNSDNIYVLFAAGEIGTAEENTFPLQNRMPGNLVLESNCARDGSVVALEIAGVLPPNRKLKAVVSRYFVDLGGQTNPSNLEPIPYQTPSLAEALNLPTVDWSTTAVADEIQEFFDRSTGLDLMDPLPLPLADVEDGYVQAALGFPGEFTTKDFVWTEDLVEVRTSSTAFVTDSSNTVHTIRSGILN